MDEGSKDATFAPYKKIASMFQQYSAAVGKFGNAYALFDASQVGKMVTIEYYLILDDSGNATIKGGILEVEALLEQTMETYVQEHVAETLPYMVIRTLVDNHTPEELEGMAEVVFVADDTVVDTLKAKYEKYAALILEKSISEVVKAAIK